MLASRIEDLIAIADSAVTVEHIATPRPYALAPSVAAAAAVADLEARSFDFAVLDEHPLARYVSARDLAPATDGATVAELARPITTHELIPGEAGLATALERLADQPVLFVFYRDGELGIVTAADLERPAVAMIALSFILVAEAGLASLLDSELGEALAQMLPPKGLAEAQRLYELKRQRHAETTLSASLTLTQRLDVVRSSERLRELLSYGSKAAVKADKERLNRLRDELAHAGDLLSAAGGDPRQAIAAILAARDFALRVCDALRVTSS